MTRFYHNPSRSPRRRGFTSIRSGFTLIEAAIVTAIVGIGIVGVLELLAAGTMANRDSAELTTAVYLANNINEMTQGVDYNVLKSSYDNHTYDPPIDMDDDRHSRPEQEVAHLRIGTRRRREFRIIEAERRNFGIHRRTRERAVFRGAT